MASTPGELTVRSGRVKHARRLATRAFRSDTGEFLAEGPQAVREALTVVGVTIEVFATAEATLRHADLQQRARQSGVQWHVVDDDVVDGISDAASPQGLVARCASVVLDLDGLPADASLVVVCVDMRDPGNAGAVIRCADAAGADAVVLCADSVDPTNPKAVRASAGSLFHLPVIVHRDLADVVAVLAARDLQVLAADGEGEMALFDAALDLARPTAWVMGNEATGLSRDARGLADAVVAVPIYGRAESLNLATAAAVCLYASARARHAG
ncbi:RNA methyltransferase [Aeromicrobium sp.]|uniref:TrmH family RNA methyltransferase n=1 Tax=Aeromicrobium sp. TaxID=1871063 RepID=UPI0019CCE44F|nr:RNA methyltransferase [Aeromicrobium sp.]MBC7633216.1 RNA methyltransferase [Aeromicrobium sp.]